MKKPTISQMNVAGAAIERMKKMNAAPRIMRTAAIVASGFKNIGYVPHIGARQKARELAKMTRMETASAE